MTDNWIHNFSVRHYNFHFTTRILGEENYGGDNFFDSVMISVAINFEVKNMTENISFLTNKKEE